MLIAGIGQVPVIVGGLVAAGFMPRAGLFLLLLGLPSGLLLFLGGLGLIYRQFAGYYCVYVATFFAGIGGFKSPYIPFLKRLVNFGPATEDLFLAFNLLLAAILAEGESYGYELTRRVRELSEGVLEWSDGMLYPVLHRLEREGLVESEWKQSATGRERKYYRLSSGGRRSLQAERKQWLTVHNTLCRLWKIKTASI